MAAAHYIRSIAPIYGIPVVLHSDHCAKKLLPWLDGMMDADEAYFKANGEPLYSSHMIDLSEEAVDWNISTTEKYLKRAAPMKQWLEMVCQTCIKSLLLLFLYPHNKPSDCGVRKLASLAVRKMALTTRTSTTTPFTRNPKISTISGRRCPKSAHISQLQPDLATYMVCTNLAT